MSMTTCTRCGDAVDTDIDTDCYDDAQCVCERCRDAFEETPVQRRYRPSNGTEGEIFMSAFCYQCARHTEDEPCSILGLMLALDIDSESYPPELVKVNGQPLCTAFIPEGEPVPMPRCTQTIDMF